MFYEKERINEYTDADIVSPYDYARRFVKITFLTSDTNESYTFLFWTLNGENSEDKFDDYKTFLTQHYVLENLDNRCIMYYGTLIQ